MDLTKALKNSFTELGERAYAGCYYTYSDFLTVAEQDILLSLRLPVRVSLNGGYEGAERRIAVFGSEEDFGYSEPSPIAYVKAEPISQKYAEPLTHRDCLGSVTGLGLRRDVTGDILISGGAAYIICLDSIADFIAENLTKIRHTDVRCTRIDSLPPISVSLPDESTVFVSSERADALVSAVYALSRSESERLFSQKLVFADARLVGDPDARIKPGSTVSVRGHGRFIYEGIARTTKKGRFCVTVRAYK